MVNNVADRNSLSVRQRICILGGGFGGLYTALYLQRWREFQDQNYQIVLVDRNDHLLFTPLLYELVTDELQAWEIAPPYQKLLAHTPIQFYQDEIEDVDLRARQVVLKERGRIDYDYLVFAVGGQSRLGDVPGSREYTISFRTLNDTQKLRQKLQALEDAGQNPIRVTIIGGGPSGVELAGKISDRLGKLGEVHLIERGEQILKGFTKATRASAYKALEKRRVRLSLQTSIASIAADQVTIVQSGQTATLPTDLVLWTAGTQISDWVKNLACPHNQQGQLLSEPTLQLVNHPEVLVLGDVAEIINNGNKPIPATAQAAYQQASCAAYNLRASIHNKRWRRFRYLHLGEMIALGKNDGAVTSFGLHFNGWFGALVRRFVYLQRLPTLSHRIQVLGYWIKNWVKGWLRKGRRRRNTDTGRFPKKI